MLELLPPAPDVLLPPLPPLVVPFEEPAPPPTGLVELPPAPEVELPELEPEPATPVAPEAVLVVVVLSPVATTTVPVPVEVVDVTVIAEEPPAFSTFPVHQQLCPHRVPKGCKGTLTLAEGISHRNNRGLVRV